MADIATISTFLTSIKTATEIAKAIKSVDVSLEKAETKLKIADLIESLAEARMQAAEIQEILQEKDGRIAELEKAFELKSKLVRDGDAYYQADENNKPTGDPYCSHCWEVNHKTIHLHYGLLRKQKKCPACQNFYDSNYTPSIKGAESQIPSPQ
ncbi:MAG TPA: hypothetical protein VGB61_10615 [Pyrinomonadaceae bacterium]|jgi:hypothetical protein